MNDEPLSGEEFRREWIRRRSADAHRRRNQRGKPASKRGPWRDAQPVVIKKPREDDSDQPT